jgi:DNA-binding beta-propeller fold protein YncE
MFRYCAIAACFCAWSASPTLAQFMKSSTIAGNGQAQEFRAAGRAKEVSVSNPFGIQQEANGDLIVVSFDQHVVYRLDSTFSQIKVIAGTGAAGLSGFDGEHPTNVMLNAPHEVQVDELGNILIADTMNHRVGLIDAATLRWHTVAGTGEPGFSGDNGLAIEAQMNQAYSIAVDGRQLFIADLGNQRIRKVDLDSGKIVTICGTGEKKSPAEGGLAIEQPLAGPRSLAVDSENIWIVLREGNSVWRIDRNDDRIYHVAGTGEKGYAGDGMNAKQAKFNGPKGIAVDPGVAVFVADTENHVIRKIDLVNKKISTVMGAAGGKPGFNGDGDELTKRALRRPHGVCLLKTGELAIGDSENHRVRLLVE